jgi:hypothetical protein
MIFKNFFSEISFFFCVPVLFFDERLNWSVSNAILSLDSVDYTREEDLVYPCNT